MFSPNAEEYSKLVELSFISGIRQENIKRFINTSDSNLLTPECLLSFPHNNHLVNNAILEYIFPTGIKLKYSEETPKFFSITLTNEKGVRSYIYILKVYEKIQYSDFLIQECIDNIEIIERHDDEENNTWKYNSQKSIKVAYIPLAICLWSYISSTDSFKEILHEGYRIITYNGKENNIVPICESSLGGIENYRFCELTNYFIFLNNILKPPTFTKMNLNFRFSNVEFYFPSNLEIPVADSNIKLLFDCLEISTIIKLWCSLLTEKHIIIIANQGYLLYSICEALLKLIFPFKWLHTYIPVLTMSQTYEFLEAPTPYLMGVLSTSADFITLKNIYPDHIICEVDSSQIHYDCLVSLPQLEESILRKKLQFVKNPEIFDIEELISKPCNKTLIDDVNPNRTFSQNVQYIFFRIIRNALTDFKKKFMVDKSFDTQQFLEDVSSRSEEHKIFWNKIVSTVAFEYFIICDEYLDDSNTSIFKNVVKYHNDICKNDYYSLSITLTQNIVPSFLDEISVILLENKHLSEFSELYKSDREKLEKYKSDYINCSNLSKTRKNSSAQFRNFENNAKSRFRNLSYDISVQSNTQNISSVLQNSLRFNNGSHLCLKILNKNIKGSLSFYSNSKTYGFLHFIDELNEMLASVSCNKDLTEFGLKNELKIAINNEIQEIKTFNSKKKQSFGKIDEIIADLESEVADVIYNNYNNRSKRNTLESTKNDQASLFTNFNMNMNIEDSIIDFEHCENAQFYLILAYYIEDLYLKQRNKKTENEKYLNKILELYEKAYFINKKEFPKVRYYQILDNWCGVDKLNEMKLKIEDLLKQDKTLIQKNKLVKIIDAKIAKSNRNKLKYLKLQSADLNKLKQKDPMTPKVNKTTKILLFSKNSDPLMDDSRRPSEQSSIFNHQLSDSSPSKDSQSKFSKKTTYESCSESSNKNFSNFLEMMRNQVKDDIKKMKKDKKDSNPLSNKSKFEDSFNNGYIKNPSIDHGNPFTFSHEINIKRTKEKKNISFMTPIYGKCDANKIMGDLRDANKFTNKITKNYIINNFIKVGKTEKDPLSISDDICLKLVALFQKYNLNNYDSDILLSSKILQTIASTSEFTNIKESLCLLQKVNVAKFSSNNEKLCFWLNLFNFLTLFTVILKNEILSNRYEWIKFLKNSLFNIGGYELSLFEIENCLITNNYCSNNIYGEEVLFNPSDIRKKLIIEDKNMLVNFGISIPTKSSVPLKIYFPNNIYDLLKKNFSDYCNSNISINYENKTINLAEYLYWVDNKFVYRLKNYKEFIDVNLYNYIETHKITNCLVNKYSWKTNFSNPSGWDSVITI